VVLLLNPLIPPGCSADLLDLAIEHRKNLTNVLRISTAEASDGELAAMVSFAIAFPNGFMVLVDTYDVKRYILAFGALTFFGSSHFSVNVCGCFPSFFLSSFQKTKNFKIKKL
jgi:hypothetical protein